jgi:hypothetical protein
VFSTHDVDIDAHAPTGKLSHIVVAMYDAYRAKFADVWNDGMTKADTVKLFESRLDPGWIFKKTRFNPVKYIKKIDGVEHEINLHGSVRVGSRLEEENYYCWHDMIGMHWYGDGIRSLAYSPTRKVFEAAKNTGLPMPFTFCIHVTVEGKSCMFYSWEELVKVSGISIHKLKSIAVVRGRGKFAIDCDSHKYKRKPIVFDL